MSDNYWDRIADLWRLFGPPIRPAADDLVVYQEIVDRATALIDGPPRVLLLGVTPELYRLRCWPMPRSRARQFVTDARSRVAGPGRHGCDWLVDCDAVRRSVLHAVAVRCRSRVARSWGRASCSLRCNGCWSRMERLRCACSRPKGAPERSPRYSRISIAGASRLLMP